ncbi:hypothetical protein LTR50_006058 [Elasticomyces elasticus]|nr:hypothetical protein LTR50_006058 [Elasticomyces elasticus]
MTDPPRPMMVIDAMRQIKEDYKRAQLILYETARLNKPWFAVIRKNRLKLSGNALLLDQKICRACEDRCLSGYVGLARIRGPGKDVNTRIMNDQSFEAMLVSSKRFLLVLEKEFRDAILDVLKAGMIGKKKVDHAFLIDKFAQIHGKVEQTWKRMNDEYSLLVDAFTSSTTD